MDHLMIVTLVNAGIKIFETVQQYQQLSGKSDEEVTKILEQLQAYRTKLQAEIKTLEDRIKAARESGL